ncbi:uncharacterized protein MISP3 isoform X2 [Ambystoma mexicanum]|uniref:uncharacterized protein MISP3 isoform X2 n=1 Tax=Ambystoma mexicanum TaxID=8296 RepID=UPI0037E85212
MEPGYLCDTGEGGHANGQLGGPDLGGPDLRATHPGEEQVGGPDLRARHPGEEQVGGPDLRAKQPGEEQVGGPDLRARHPGEEQVGGPDLRARQPGEEQVGEPADTSRRYHCDGQPEGLPGASTGGHGHRQQEGPPNPSTGDHGDEQQDEIPDPDPTYQDQCKRAGASDLSGGCPGVTDDAPPSPEELRPAAAIRHQQGVGEAFCMSPQASSPMATCTTEPGSATTGLSVSTTGGARRDNSEQGVAVRQACPQHSQQVGRALPAEPVNQSQPAERAPEQALNTRQDTGDPAAIQESGHLTTSQDTGDPATSQESVAPATSQGSGALSTRQDTGAPATGQESGAPATSQESGHLTSSQESGTPATRQESGDLTTSQESETPATRQESETPATRQESGTPATSQESEAPATRQESGTPATRQESGTPATSQESEAPATRQESGALTTSPENEPLTTSQEIDSSSRSQEAAATATSPAFASTPQSVLPPTISQEVTPPSTVQDIALLPRALDTPASPTEAHLSGTSSFLGISSLPSHPPPATNIPCSSTASGDSGLSSALSAPQELSSLPIAPGRDSLRTKGPMEVEQEDNLSDSGVSADFSPGSTLEMDGEIANETPIEREIRRNAEREETLRKERGMAPTADHQQFVEVRMKPILNRGLADTFPPKEKDRQRAGAQMQRDIRMESQREEDLVQLGKVMGAYDRGLPQELREKKMVFEQKAELSNGELASLRKITRSPYGEVQPANNSSYRDVETMPQQSSGSPPMVQQRSTWEKKGPSYAEANGSNVIILDYNALLHRTPTGRDPPTQAQGTGLGSELSNVSQSSSNGLQLRTSNVTTNSLQSGTYNISQSSANGLWSGTTNSSTNGHQSGTTTISQSPANDLLLSSGGQQAPPSPTEDEVVQENPFFRLKTKSPQSLLELEIREVRERESELRRLRRSLYGGQHAQGTVGDNGSDPAKEHSDEPEAAPGQPERPYSGKLEVTWPPRGWGQADRKESEQEDRSASMARQKNSLLQRWETGMVSSQQSMEDE